MQIKTPWIDRSETRAVMTALAESGTPAYFVGGCVRNTIIGAAVTDIDIATATLPEAVMELAEAAGLKALPTGIEHGTVTVVSGGIPHEVTTFRKDVDTDGRRAVVAFSDRIEDDARRRDFTMNALYADAQGYVVDPLEGLDDLLAQHVRFIEDAHRRIAEDYLRILRFFRFHAWYGDPERGLDADGLTACAAAVAGIARLSRERIGAEIQKLLSAPDPRQSLRNMDDIGVLGAALPGSEHTAAENLIALEIATQSAPDWLRRLVALGASNPVDDLRLSRRQARHLDQMKQGLAGEFDVSELAYRYDGLVARGVALLRAAQSGGDLPADLQKNIDKGLRARFPVDAADLMDRYSGKELGDVLKLLENRWILSGFSLSKESLLHDI